MKIYSPVPPPVVHMVRITAGRKGEKYAYLCLEETNVDEVYEWAKQVLAPHIDGWAKMGRAGQKCGPSTSLHIQSAVNGSIVGECGTSRHLSFYGPLPSQAVAILTAAVFNTATQKAIPNDHQTQI